MSVIQKREFHPYKGRRFPSWGKVLLALVLAGAVAFGVLEALVLGGGRTQIVNEPEVMVIFGCQVKPWGPSILLQDRLDTALDYLEDHPDVTVVVAGGKGNDEPVSEAQCMYDYLTEHGVDGDKIVLEDASRNTWQNINNTLALMQAGEVEGTGKFILVSSDFHLTRIKMLWGRTWEGTYSLSTLAAPVSHFPSRLKMFFREPLALVKSFVFDR
ncbi:MAG: YdcF family protein [Lawsonibacter sp.]|nr:YdcF family protein [Lawsonibacter sp.]